MELDQGGIYIDGVEIAKLGLAQLRNAMAIIPQVSLVLHVITVSRFAAKTVSISKS